jgi:FkbM family methyltransferase
VLLRPYSEGAKMITAIKRNATDKKIYSHFKGRIGTFVEFGAYDGVQYSTCANFAKSGWSGLYAEPVKSYYRKLVKNYGENKRIRLANVAVGGKSGQIEIVLAGVASSAVPAYQNYPEWQHFKTGGAAIVAQITLEELLTSYKIPVGFELLVVDVEGMEWDVFKPFDIGKWKPEMVLVELHEINVHRGDVIRYFLKNGYEEVCRDKVNVLFQRK